jgi:arginyl-tRNA synthetase
MEQKNNESLKMWQSFKDLSINELIQIYEKLNIKFDIYESESEYYLLAKEYVQHLLNKGIAKRLENDAIEVNFKNIKYIIQKKDQSTLYISRDLAALIERKKKYNFSKIIYVVDSSQKDHFFKLYETVNHFDSECLKNISYQEFYVPFGRLTNMSTRRGKIEFLNDLIDEAKQVALESMEDLKIKKNVENIEYAAQILGNSHLIITDLARPRLKDYEFSWKNIVSKDESAFMCHYSHARLFNLIDKCKQELNIEPSLKDTDLSYLKSNIELALIQHLGRFDDVLWMAYQDYEPYHIVQYLFQLVRLTNNCMSEKYVIGQDIKTAQVLICFFFLKIILIRIFKAIQNI